MSVCVFVALPRQCLCVAIVSDAGKFEGDPWASSGGHVALPGLCAMFNLIMPTCHNHHTGHKFLCAEIYFSQIKTNNNLLAQPT